MFLSKGFLLGSYLTYASASAVLPQRSSILQARDTVNGSCISGPDTSCVSLVSLCVASIASGEVGSTAFWSSNVCTAAATTFQMGAVLNAACCAGTCRQPLDINSLDYDNVYATMVGDCAYQPGGCSLTWQPFVDWFYNTIQGTGTNMWPLSGDYVLGWWSEIATWTGFCTGDECVDGAIPYTNFNDWFHYSSAVAVTTPGTPEYAPPLSTNIADNQDMWTPNFYWPCPFDDLDECWWDYGPPTAATSISSNIAPAVVANVAQVKQPTLGRSANFTTSSVARSDFQLNSPFPFGRASYEPANTPPPVYVNGKLITIHLNGTTVNWEHDTDTTSLGADTVPGSISPTPTRVEPTPATTVSGALVKRATITPAACNGGRSPIETPAVLPTLTYFCSFLPNICANIRSHGDWDHTTDSMELTYDPFGDSSNRRDVCTTDVKTVFQVAGQCDPMDHNPVDWKVSCDEFPFNSSLEGGEGNAIVQRVPTREQQYQGTLQSSITYLRRIQTNGATSWQGNSGKMCHKYVLKLVDNVPANADAGSIGSLDPGSAFFAKTNTLKWIKDKRVLNNRYPRSFTSTSWAYAATDTALGVPGWKAVTFNCAPTSTACTTTTNVPRALATPTQHAVRQPHAPPALIQKRDDPACTISSQPPLPTTSAAASALASDSADTAEAAAAAAAAALASASNPTADEAAAAAAAVSAAAALAPAAAALASAADDASIATAAAAAQSAYDDAQDSISSILSLGPDIPDWLSSIHDSVSSSSSAVAKAIASQQNVMNPQTRSPPDTAPINNPVINNGPPPNVPPAACFPAGSTGFVKIGDAYLVNQNGKAPATLVDVGSDAYFGMTIPTNVAVEPVDGCQSIYTWNFNAPALQPDFQVDCSTNELGGYWNGEKLTCYAYPTTNGQFIVICGDNIANVYSCLQNSGMYGQVTSAVFTWATS
ncbi:hypothetical protein C8Q70DRAFT_913797 [Cubamyces menziesii]|nr:hypothetical protein C8Q70DRAFT_913797 [Cubamyces menziesii]